MVPDTDSRCLEGERESGFISGRCKTPRTSSSGLTTYLALDRFDAFFESRRSLTDPEDDRDSGGSWIEHARWLDESGELDALVENGTFDSEIAADIRSMNLKAEQILAEQRAALPSRVHKLPTLQRTLTEITMHHGTEGLREIGLIGSDGRRGRVAGDSRPHHRSNLTRDRRDLCLFRCRTGIRVGGVASSICFNSLSLTFRSATCHTLCSNGSKNMATPPKNAIVIQRSDIDGEGRLSLLFRYTRPPGGYFPIHLGDRASSRFVKIIAELAANKWGPLATVDGPAPS